MEGEEESNIDKLKEKLYSRDYKPEKTKRSEVSPRKFDDIRTNWQDDTKKESRFSGKGDDIIKWFLIISIVFFVIASVIAAFVFIKGSVNVSARNVDVRVIGPVAISGGDELELEIVVDNKNNVTMEATDVFVEYPDGTRSTENLEEEFLRDHKDYGSISPGRNSRETFKAVLFGEQDSVKEIKVRVEYRVVGSSATFEKEKNYEVKISSSPVLVKIEYPHEVRSGQDIEFGVVVSSNSTNDLSGILLTADYPSGFSFKSSSPDSTYDTDTWLIGNLSPEDKKTITIRGILQGQDNEERTFRFGVGTQSSEEEDRLGATYVSSSNTIKITRPGLSTRATINGSSSNTVVASAGDNVQTVISWINSLDTKIVNASITSYLGGDLINKGSISTSPGGFYRSSDDSVFWNQNSNSSLAEISPAEGKTVDFGFSLNNLTNSLASTLRNPVINIDIYMEGTRFGDGDTPGDVNTTLSKQIQIESNIDLTSDAVRSVGPIENSGPVPPKVGQKTTYTVRWSLTNSFNDVGGVQVIAQLPSYVDWDGTYAPSTENLTFNPTTKQVTWSIPTLSSGTGFSSFKKEVNFRISLTPSASQIGNIPVILQNISAGGRDKFTNTNLSDSASNITTLVENDPGFQDGQEIVVE